MVTITVNSLHATDFFVYVTPGDIRKPDFIREYRKRPMA